MSCKYCGSIDTMKWRKECRSCRNHKAKIRMRKTDRPAYYLKSKYGITKEQYLTMCKDQNNTCAVCGIHRDSQKRPLAVDHCHKTGVVRGILCTNCNAALGQLKEDIKIMYKLIEYTKEKCNAHVVP